MDEFRFLLQSTANKKISQLTSNQKAQYTYVINFLKEKQYDIEKAYTILDQLYLRYIKVEKNTVLWEIRHILNYTLPDNTFDFFIGIKVNNDFSIISKPIAPSNVIKVIVDEQFDGFDKFELEKTHQYNIEYVNFIKATRDVTQINSTPDLLEKWSKYQETTNMTITSKITLLSLIFGAFFILRLSLIQKRF